MLPARHLIFCSAEALPAVGVFGRDLSMADYRRYLGRSLEALYWDASDGLHPNALAALIPCIVAGGSLFLHLPAATRGDGDHRRYLDAGLNPEWCQPRFHQRLRRMAWRPQHQEEPPEALPWPLPLPLAILGKRGRGKTHVLRRLAEAQARPLWVSPFRPDFAPSYFLPPDEALRRRPPADLLCIDEAAALHPAQLLALTAHYPRYALASSEDGYEGHGRLFSLQLLPQLETRDGLQRLHLQGAWRYGADALEDWAERVFLHHVSLPEPAEPQRIRLWRSEEEDEALLRSIYALLQQQHYRSRPDDLKRLLDLPGQRIYIAENGRDVGAVLQAIHETPLPERLARAVIAGQRRPRGRLFLQQLLRQQGRLADNRDYWRISRIAVHPRWRRQGWARRLLQALAAESAWPLAVSFRRQASLLDFWRAVGLVECGLNAQNHVLMRAFPEALALENKE